MELDLKGLKKLADICRGAGIKMFKGYGVEFELSDTAPMKAKRSKGLTHQAAPAQGSDQALVDPEGWDSLSIEDKLFYSASGQVPEGVTEE